MIWSWFEERCWINPANDSLFFLSLYPTLTFCFYFTGLLLGRTFLLFYCTGDRERETWIVLSFDVWLSWCVCPASMFCSFMLFLLPLPFSFLSFITTTTTTPSFPLLCAKHAISFVPWVNSPREGRNGSLSNVQMSLIFKFLSLLS